VLWRESKLERVQMCGRVPVTPSGQVGLVNNGGVSHYRGLGTCGSIWACPVCSAKIRGGRAEEISKAAGNWDRAGNTVYLVTLTMPHDYGQRLKLLLSTVAETFSQVIAGGSWLRLKKKVRIVGNIRAMEITHGPNGWHPHLHVLMFIEGQPDAAQLAAFKIYFQRKWGEFIVRAGFRAPNGHGVDIQLCKSAAEAGEYIAKVQETGRAVGNEVARSDTKRGRGADHRTPFEILADFAATGDAVDLALWHEYEKATKRRQAIAWSKGLRELLLGMTDDDAPSNEDLAAAEVGGEVVALIPGPVWKRIVSVPGLPEHLLTCHERGGLEAFNEELEAHGCGSALLPLPETFTGGVP